MMPLFRYALLVPLATLLVLLANVAAADPYGDPFRVNTYTPGNQYLSKVSTGANGDTAILISDAGRGNAVFLRRYDAAGLALTAEEWFVGFGVYGVAVSGTGNYAILRSAPDGSGNGVFVTLYNRAGSVVVPEFRVNDVTAGEQYVDAVAMNASGQFVVGWSQWNGSGMDYLVKRYQANGAAVAPAALVRTTPYNTVGMDLAIDGQGNFVTTWSELLSPSGNNFDVYARRFSSTGYALGSAFRVNSYTTGIQVSPLVAMNATGSFVVTWTSYGQTAANAWSVYAQRYGATGVRLGGEFQVDTATSYNQPGSGLAVASNGSFVITWNVDNRAVDPTALPVVLARNYGADGVATGAPFGVSTAADKLNMYPYIGMDPNGNAIIGWWQYDPVTTDVDSYARRYLPVGAVAQPLANPGQATGLAGAANSWQYFKITVPSGHTTFDVSIFGDNGDADLYVRYGVLPSPGDWDARPYQDGSYESVRMQNWPAGDWYIGINGYTSYSALGLRGASY